MGPLFVNEIISENTNLLLAFIIGIGFGFVLESNGFSSSRRLAGMFYGYDTTVLKVFFTAAIVGALGLLFLSLFHQIDLNYIYINPTYMYSAIGGELLWESALFWVVIAPEPRSVQRPLANSMHWHLLAECSSVFLYFQKDIRFGKIFTMRSFWVHRY
jgi:hypothetical protein